MEVIPTVLDEELSLRNCPSVSIYSLETMRVLCPEHGTKAYHCLQGIFVDVLDEF